MNFVIIILCSVNVGLKLKARMKAIIAYAKNSLIKIIKCTYIRPQEK